MAREIRISPMSIGHYDAVYALWASTDGILIDATEDRDGVAVFLERNPQTSHVATLDDRIIGAALCGHDGRRGYLHHLAVVPEYRGQGIGRRIVNACLNRLREQGIKRCNLFVVDDDRESKQFWQNDGWVEWKNICLMSKDLQPDDLLEPTMTHLSPPDFPAGEFSPVSKYDTDVRHQLIDALRRAPENLRDAVAGLSETQLGALYKNWTARQIVHHLADSHVHSYIRFKWALTEDNPTIKAYEEGDWVNLDDANHGDIEPSLALLDGLHCKWVQLLKSMTRQQYARTFVHPQTQETVDLWTALNYYPWHAQHHTAQILWLRDRHGW